MHGSTSRFADDLLRWYDRSRRDLPWRVPSAGGDRPDPYHVLVSELMLQQTQVATVIPYFQRFIARLPTVAALATADEQEVLRLWQGLGYYSRARNLQRAARQIIERFDGQLPDEPDALLSLPGVGRYTAGAIGSIAYGHRAPILDGNVMRVLCRIDAIEGDPRQPLLLKQLWSRAEQVLPNERVGDFNSALMELGATVCTPRSPCCLVCPVRNHCEAAGKGIAEQIPPVRKTKPTPLERRIVLCILRDGQWLIEQRPPKGRWAGMWQFVARTAPARGVTLELPLPITRQRRLGTIRHQLTHRRYMFDIRIAETADASQPRINAPHRWIRLDGLKDIPMPRPHVLIAAMLADRDVAPAAARRTAAGTENGRDE